MNVRHAHTLKLPSPWLFEIMRINYTNKYMCTIKRIKTQSLIYVTFRACLLYK